MNTSDHTNRLSCAYACSVKVIAFWCLSFAYDFIYKNKSLTLDAIETSVNIERGLCFIYEYKYICYTVLGV